MRGIYLEDDRKWVAKAEEGVVFDADQKLPRRNTAWLSRRAGMLGVLARDGIHLLGMHVVPLGEGEQALYNVDRDKKAPLHPGSPAQGGVLLSNTPYAWGKTPGIMNVYMTPPLSGVDIELMHGEPNNLLLRAARRVIVGMGERATGGPPDSMSRREFNGAKLGLVPVSHVWLGQHPSQLPDSGLNPVWAVYTGTQPLIRVGSVPAYQGGA